MTCQEPEQMLTFLRTRTSARKLRLFAVNCGHRYAAMLTPALIDALAIAEQVADGVIPDQTRKHARAQAFAAPWHPDPSWRHRRGPAKACVTWALARRAFDAATAVLHLSQHIGVLSARDWPAEATAMAPNHRSAIEWSNSRVEQQRIHAAMLRDLLGNPFHPVLHDPVWEHPSIQRHTQQIVTTQQFSAVRHLGHALYAAGCRNMSVLAHCASDEPHARGCWVLDAILQRS
jgi:hypothetical protein